MWSYGNNICPIPSLAISSRSKTAASSATEESITFLFLMRCEKADLKKKNREPHQVGVLLTLSHTGQSFD